MYNLFPRSKIVIKSIIKHLIIALMAASLIVNLYIIAISPLTLITGGMGGGGTSDIIVKNIQIISIPTRLEDMPVKQSFVFTIKIIPSSGQVPITRPGGNINGTRSSLQNLLGLHNSACIFAQLNFDPEKFDVSPSQMRVYSLDQEILRWDWIITPKQTGRQFIELDIEVVGEKHCSGTAFEAEPVEGPYLISTSPTYSFQVIDSNVNPITHVLQNFDPGTGLTTAMGGALSTVFASFIAWTGVKLLKLKRSQNKKTEQNRRKANNRTRKRKKP